MLICRIKKEVLTALALLVLTTSGSPFISNAKATEFISDITFTYFDGAEWFHVNNGLGDATNPSVFQPRTFSGNPVYENTFANTAPIGIFGGGLADYEFLGSVEITASELLADNSVNPGQTGNGDAIGVFDGGNNIEILIKAKAVTHLGNIAYFDLNNEILLLRAVMDQATFQAFENPNIENSNQALAQAFFEPVEGAFFDGALFDVKIGDFRADFTFNNNTTPVLTDFSTSDYISNTGILASQLKIVANIPEPATILLLGTGSLALARFRRKNCVSFDNGQS